MFGCKEYNQSDFGIDHLVISMYRVFSCVVGRGCLLRPVHFLGKTLLVSALLHSVFQGQICLLLQEEHLQIIIMLPSTSAGTLPESQPKRQKVGEEKIKERKMDGSCPGNNGIVEPEPPNS